ncbi:MAG: hypothetical protein R2911_44715 [Caldilineaceae bacterium]
MAWCGLYPQVSKPFDCAHAEARVSDPLGFDTVANSRNLLNRR